jgi:hypothetical protein
LFQKIGALLHLDWVYNTSEEPQSSLISGKLTTDENTIIPPVSELNTLHKYAEYGDMLAILQHLDQLEQQDARYRQFAGEIRQLAKAFQDEEICQTIDRYRGESV